MRAARVDLADDLEDRLHNLRSQAERGFVEEQQSRPREQGARDREHLLLTAREGARILTESLSQPRKERESALAVLGDPRRIAAREGSDLEVLVHRQVGEDPAALGRVRDPEPHDLVRREGGERIGRRT